MEVLADRFAGGDTIRMLARDYRLPLNVVEYAIQQFLERAKDPAFRIGVGDPRTSKADV